MLQITYSFRAQNFPCYTPMHGPGCLHDKENFLLPSWMQVEWPEFQLSVISLESFYCKKLNVEMQEASILGMQIAPTGTKFLGCLNACSWETYGQAHYKITAKCLSQNETTRDHHAFLALYGLFPDMIKLFWNKDVKRIVVFTGFSFGTL